MKDQVGSGRFVEQARGVTANESIAFDWYGKAAKRGHLKATAALAECYFNGHGFKTDTEVAFGLFNHALERGSFDAMRRLASICLDGVLVKKDYDIAASFYRKAADKGDPAAQFSMAVMLDITRNRDAAIAWYQDAARQGHNSSQKRLLKLQLDW